MVRQAHHAREPRGKQEHQAPRLSDVDAISPFGFRAVKRAVGSGKRCRKRRLCVDERDADACSERNDRLAPCGGGLVQFHAQPLGDGLRFAPQ